MILSFATQTESTIDDFVFTDAMDEPISRIDNSYPKQSLLGVCRKLREGANKTDDTFIYVLAQVFGAAVVDDPLGENKPLTLGSVGLAPHPLLE